MLTGGQARRLARPEPEVHRAYMRDLMSPQEQALVPALPRQGRHHPAHADARCRNLYLTLAAHIVGVIPSRAELALSTHRPTFAYAM